MACGQPGPAPEVMESPGQHARHYSPRTPLHLLPFRWETPPGRGLILDLPRECAPYAANLYAALRTADKEGWDWLGVVEPPDKPEWAGIRDRLRRASYRED
jgi:L-threonylcarbamoyladenylate synthase